MSCLVADLTQYSRHTTDDDIHGYTVPMKRMKLRSSSIHATDGMIESPSSRRTELWSNHLQFVPTS